MTQRRSVRLSRWRRWFGYVLRQQRYLVPALVVVVVGMAAEVMLPKIIGFVIDDLLRGTAGAAGRVPLPVLGTVSLQQAFVAVFLALLGLLTLRSVAMYLRSYLLALVGEHVHLEIRGNLFAHLQRLPISFFDTSYTGRIMARITTDADALWHLVHDGILQVVAPAATVVVVLIILLRIHVGLTLFSLLCVPLIAVIYLRVRRRATETGRAQREALASIYSRLQERISGIRHIRIFGRGHMEVQSFAEELRMLFQRNIQLVRTYGALGAKSQFLTGATTAAILCLGGIAATRGSLTVGELVQFYLYAGMLFAPLDMITRASARIFTDGEVAMERIFDLLDTPEAQELSGPNRPCPRLQGQVRVDRLCFAYGDGEEVLKDVSFEVQAGQTVALVGPSGAGKTTLVNLLCRFYPPTGGSLLADGQSIDQYEVESYRRQISYVTQEDFLFSGTVAENLRYAKADATDEELERAARRASAHDFILRLPCGYDTSIGERGVMLSGGQKQRLNVARALLREPAILILDEPTSALDAESESVILEALQTVFRDVTVFIIAHRLSTVMSADRILVFQEGQIVQQGDHRSLLAAPGLYRSLCEKQLLGYGGTHR